jgi:hypothetical protein
MNQSKRLDNLMVHVQAGTLSTDVSLRRRPHQQIISRYVDLVMPTAVVQWPSAALNTLALRAILLAKSYSAFLHEPNTDTDPVELMGAIASFYTNTLDPSEQRRTTCKCIHGSQNKHRIQAIQRTC